jgi:hypothetical protein
MTTTNNPATPVSHRWRGYSLLHWLICVFALVFAVIWILAVAGLGFSAPSWVPASAVLCLALALWIP